MGSTVGSFLSVHLRTLSTSNWASLEAGPPIFLESSADKTHGNFNPIAKRFVNTANNSGPNTDHYEPHLVPLFPRILRRLLVLRFFHRRSSQVSSLRHYHRLSSLWTSSGSTVGDRVESLLEFKVTNFHSAALIKSCILFVEEQQNIGKEALHLHKPRSIDLITLCRSGYFAVWSLMRLST